MRGGDPVKPPGDTPNAAMLTTRRIAGEFGITAERWDCRVRVINAPRQGPREATDPARVRQRSSHRFASE